MGGGRRARDHERAHGAPHRDRRSPVRWTRALPPREVTAVLQAAGVPAGFMQRPDEYEDDPQFQARDFLRTFEQPGLAPRALDNAPFRSSGSPRRRRSRRPSRASTRGRSAPGCSASDRRGRPADRARRARGAGAVTRGWGACTASVRNGRRARVDGKAVLKPYAPEVCCPAPEQRYRPHITRATMSTPWLLLSATAVRELG